VSASSVNLSCSSSLLLRKSESNRIALSFPMMLFISVKSEVFQTLPVVDDLVCARGSVLQESVAKDLPMVGASFDECGCGTPD